MTMEKITDHLFTTFVMGDASSDSCIVCNEAEAEHDDDNYDPTPEYFAYDGPYDSMEFNNDRFELGE